jgi:hypothetical protein
MKCPHSEIDATVKGSCVNGHTMIAIKIFCLQCLTDFEYQPEIYRSLDNRQLMVEIFPAAGMLVDTSQRNH